MRKVEKRALYEDITIFIGKKLDKLNIEGWLDKEIYEKTGIIQTRLTETKNYEKYGRPITEKHLAAFIGGGIVTITELKEGVNMSKEGVKHIDDMAFYGNKEIRVIFRQLQDAGIDPLKELKKLLKVKK